MIGDLSTQGFLISAGWLLFWYAVLTVTLKFSEKNHEVSEAIKSAESQFEVEEEADAK